ncbi:MAG: YhbY family RNA-binding protein [Lysobacteraceae bacterium]
MPASLSPAQIRYLRSLAHDLKPVVMVGGKGVTDGVVAELDLALAHHELLKVRISADDRDARDEAVADLLARVDAVLVQRIGNIAVAYRRHPQQPRIVLPR